MKKISIIVAIAEDNGIGKDNKLLCHLPADLKRFRNITSGHTVIMGKNTFLSLPGGALKNRRNIVLSDNPGDKFDGCETVSSVEEAITKCDNHAESFIIGGASVYRQFLPFASRLYLTRIHETFQADTFFPEIHPAVWTEISREQPPAEEGYNFSYEFIVLQRKN